MFCHPLVYVRGSYLVVCMYISVLFFFPTFFAAQGA